VKASQAHTVDENESQTKEPISLGIKLSIICLWFLCVISAISVIYATFNVREKIRYLEEIRRIETHHRVLSGQYQLEKSALAAYPRVEAIAEDQLGMVAPKTDETIFVVKQ